MSQINLFTGEEKEIVYSNQSKWAKLIKTRDGWQCANKEKLPNLNHQLYVPNAHHILPKKLGGKNILSNGITYCRACHAAEHPEYQQKFFDIFKLEIVRIKDFVMSLIGIGGELQFYRWLQFLTGKVSFRPLQKKIIKTIVENKKHVFAVMPTGSGKSLLYQIPGLINNNNPSLIISPLKALQVDQVNGLLRRWIPATYINSSLDSNEISERIKGIIQKMFLFVFIHPKQLIAFNEKDQETNIKYSKPLASLKFDYIVVDEVHVIKSQGLSFVKEYYHLDEIYNLFNKPQMVLLTATASKKTRDFIVERLGLKKGEVVEFVSGFMRPEISLEVYSVNIYSEKQKQFIDKNDSLIYLLNHKPIGKTIIFATTTKEVDLLNDLLKEEGFNVRKFHSKLSKEERELNYKSFIGQISGNEIDIMIATSAFGMGIDIPDIHQIIHYSLPFSMTDYYQQVGRAGRDGKASVAQLLYNEKEALGMVDYINSKTLENEENEEIRKILLRSFKEEKESLLGYVNASNKWQYILDYFGEPRKNILLSNYLIFPIIIVGLLAIYWLYVYM